ncbi:MAG: ATP-binding protein, partial [Fulvivirga sp.]|uniref:sensor histidine kinase n=1 Tax=Fulvivirga sp. TaxID=1931237 RepID=UPI0032EAB40A
KLYLIGVGFIFIDVVVFRAVLNYENRYNEIFMVGYSTIIVVLLDNPGKLILFLLTALSTLVMITIRQTQAGLEITNDTIMAYLNTSIAFFCVYYFTAVYRNALLANVDKLKEYSRTLEEQEKEIIQQRDEIFRNRQLLRATIDSLPLFIGLIDMNGKYLIANSLYEKTFNKPVREIETLHYTSVLPPNIRKIHEPLIKEGLKGNSPKFNEQVKMPDGRNIHTLGRYIPIYDSNKVQFALAVYVINITDLKTTEKKLIELNKTKNRLLSIISHDIKGPLNSLKGMMSIRDTMSEKEFEEFNNKLSIQLGKVTFNIDNLLNWAKTQMEGFKSKPEKVNIETILEQNIDLYKEDLEAKNIALTSSHVVTSEAWVDQESLKLVVRNLLSNAIKFTPEKGTIEVISSEGPDEIIIDIIDSGVGISEARIKELQAGAKSIKSESGTLGESGTGLGLSLSIDLIKLNKGKLMLTNNKTTGTTARIILPKNKS